MNLTINQDIAIQKSCDFKPSVCQKIKLSIDINNLFFKIVAVVDSLGTLWPLT